MKHIILASASPRRQELLRLITEEFTICPADADETLPDGLPVERQIETLAFRKAEAVFPGEPGLYRHRLRYHGRGGRQASWQAKECRRRAAHAAFAVRTRS